MDENEREADELHAIRFGIRRSVRYHNRRRSFFESLQTVSQLASVLFGTAVFFSTLSNLGRAWPLVASLIVTVLSALSLVISPTKRAFQHENLARRFSELEAECDVAPISADSVSSLRCKRLSIERDEPPKLVVLDSMCHNELVYADGHPVRHEAQILWYQRALANVCDVRPHRARLPQPEQIAAMDRTNVESPAVTLPVAHRSAATDDEI